MSTNTAPTTGLEIKRLIKAPRQRVFDAWTKPDDILKWFGPDTCYAISAKVDLRTGGEYHIRVHTDMVGETDVSGVYREVSQPSRLVYTWKWSNPKMDFGESLVTVDFVEVNGWTEVRIRHDGFPGDEIRDNHSYGWNGCLDKLETKLGVATTPSGCPTVGEFSWNELVTSDVPAAAKFYTGLFGWKAEEFPMGEMKYTLFMQNGVKVGGMMKAPSEHMPPQWVSYVTVASADEAAKRAAELGGKVMAPPFDVPTVGRLAVLIDPQGAGFAVFQPEKK